MTKTTRHFAPLALALLAGSALATPAPAPQPERSAAPSTAAPATRDWTRIDTDRDGYVSAAEMQTFLVAEQTRARPANVATR